MAAKLKIDIISDTICPWCFIGKRRLEKAIEQFQSTNPNVSFDIEWHPFQLSPTMSKNNPKSKMEHYRRKFGEQRAAEMVPYMQSVGAPEGIKFSYGGVMANTLDSHRLIYWSKQFGKQSELVEELFKDYFERERNIGDNHVLAAAAGRVGLDSEQALNYLDSDADVDLVRATAERNKTESISGVPNYTIQHRFGFPGAQEPGTFTHFFEKALRELKETPSTL
ncbi:thioredoxin-like protein [Zychaea mexicana]|uniref:thioredoxin-like protein n=1 Tax=Zychaea mexicana TaxID=64656 RepID=UPI0022FEC4C4|nr:thioredoxin-like protein [Zychaea mexicana]KAI9499635.1 thioredoxin-like protein [Zychaea mexicana]